VVNYKIASEKLEKFAPQKNATSDQHIGKWGAEEKRRKCRRMCEYSSVH